MKRERPSQAARSGRKESDLLLRGQVARLLGLSEKEVEQMHGAELHPSQDSVRRWRYSPEEVAQQMRGGGRSPREEGRITAAAFAMFKDGQALADVVVALQISVAQVRQMRAEYDELAGTLTIRQAAAIELRDALGGQPVGDGTAFVEAVKAMIGRTYARGYEDGKSDAEDYGEIIDFSTGERRRVPGPR